MQREHAVKFGAGAATAELCNSGSFNMQHQEREKQRILQRGRRL